MRPYTHLWSCGPKQTPHLQGSEFAALHKKKNKKVVVLGIPRIELGTLRSLSVHLTTRLNPQLVLYVCMQKFRNEERGSKFRRFRNHLRRASLNDGLETLQESMHVFHVTEN